MTLWTLPALLLMGVAVGPNGLNLLTPSVVLLLDPIVAMALAMIGVFVGLNVDLHKPRADASMVIALLGGVAIGFSREASPVALFLITLAIAGVAIVVAFAGWLLVGQADSEREQQVFVIGALLLLGGGAAYASLSAVFAGLLAGIVWSVGGDLARARIVTAARLLPASAARRDAARDRSVDHRLGRGRSPGARRADRCICARDGARATSAVPVMSVVRWCGRDRGGARRVPGSAAVIRLAAVALVVAAMVVVRQLGPAASEDARGTALALGFTLIVALVTGEFLRRFRLPRLTGYLLFGLLVGPYLGNVITEAMARQLQLVTGIATTLIAFIAGLTLNIERLERRVAGAGVTTLITLAMAMSGMALLAWIVWPWLPIAPQATGTAKLAMIALLVVIVVSFSPTMSAAVIAETGSRGKLSDFVLAMVVLADLVVLVLFSLCHATWPARHSVTSAPEDVNMLVRLAWEIGGAVAFG